MISPTVGRIVLFHPHLDQGGDVDGQPHAAIVAHVLDDRLINLTVFNENGSVYAKQNVVLVQDGDATPDGAYAEWMAYQKGQAAKAEAATGTADKAVADLAVDVDAKFTALGDWLQPALAALDQRLTVLSTPVETPPPQPDTSGGGASQAQA